MSTFLRLAFRNVLRNRARSALTLGAIAFGVFATIFMGGFVEGFQNMLVDDAVKGRVGALQVHRKGYFDVKDNQPIDFDMEAGGALEARLAAIPGVTAVSPRIAFSGLVNNGTSSTLFVGIAVRPGSDAAVIPNWTREVTGRQISDELPRGGVLGVELARALGAKAGDSLTLQASTQAGRQNAFDLDVVGTVNNGNNFESKRSVYVSLAYAQELLGMPGRATEYVVAVNDRSEVDAVAGRVAAALGPEFEVQTWRELRPNVANVVRFSGVVLLAICIIFLIIAVIGVVNTMLMSVLERTREIGTMMAVGVRREQITRLFLLEGAALATLGGGAGALLGFAVIRWMELRGGFLLPAPGTTVQYALVPVTTPLLVLLALAGAALGTVGAAVYPAWRASRLRPVEALAST